MHANTHQWNTKEAGSVSLFFQCGRNSAWMCTLNRVICSYRFINICRRTSTNTQTLPPHLFSFHHQDFKAHFVSSATVPPFLPTYLLSLLLLQPSPTAGGEIISNTPSLVLASPPFLVSLQPFSQHLPHSASCLSLFSFFTFLPLVC